MAFRVPGWGQRVFLPRWAAWAQALAPVLEGGTLVAGRKSRAKVSRAMREVHRKTPRTVTRAKVTGKRKERMLRAIALSKARKR